MSAIIEGFKQGGGVSLSMISLFLSNFREACEKQRRPRMANLFGLLARSFEIQAKNGVKRAEAGRLLKEFQESLGGDLEEHYPAVEMMGREQGNRGVLRMKTWGAKVTTIQNALVKRYQKSGVSLLKEGQKMFVCGACGFIGIGTEPPGVCPVCKAPAARFYALT
jgi:rubrerythrin